MPGMKADEDDAGHVIHTNAARQIELSVLIYCLTKKRLNRSRRDNRKLIYHYDLYQTSTNTLCDFHNTITCFSPLSLPIGR